MLKTYLIFYSFLFILFLLLCSFIISNTTIFSSKEEKDFISIFVQNPNIEITELEISDINERLNKEHANELKSILDTNDISAKEYRAIILLRILMSKYEDINTEYNIDTALIEYLKSIERYFNNDTINNMCITTALNTLSSLNSEVGNKFLINRIESKSIIPYINDSKDQISMSEIIKRNCIKAIHYHNVTGQRYEVKSGKK